MKKKASINYVAYITDEAYVMPTCVSIMSLICNNLQGKTYYIYIIANHISKESREKLLSIKDPYATVFLKEVEGNIYDNIVENCLTKERYVSATALLKFDIMNILDKVEKILYLDSDVIINKDISALFDINLEGYYLAAVDDMGDEILEDGSSFLAGKIGIHNRNYFNSGIMLFNLRKMREHKIYAKLVDYRTNGINYFMDQDAFNAVIGSKRLKLPYKYNFRAALFDVMDIEKINISFFGEPYKSIEACLADQSIIHMTDRKKPWKYNMPWLTEIFMKYYHISPFAEENLMLISPIKEWRDWWLDAMNVIESYKRLEEKYIILKRENANMCWPFPFEKVLKGSKIVLYGAGKVGKDFYNQINGSQYCDIICWVDKKWSENPEILQSPAVIRTINYDYIVIAISNEVVVKEIEENLVSLGICPDRIIKIPKKHL